MVPALAQQPPLGLQPCRRGAGTEGEPGEGAGGCPGFVPELAGMMLGGVVLNRGQRQGQPDNGEAAGTVPSQGAGPSRGGEASPARPPRADAPQRPRVARGPARKAPRRLRRLLRRALIRPPVPSHHPFPWAPEVPKGTAGTT